MALVAKPDLLSDFGEGLIAPPHQSFGLLEPTLNGHSSAYHADRLLEGAVRSYRLRHATPARSLNVSRLSRWVSI
jgi:hypothetical protein